ncbi:MAG: M23 family metallopeptidase [Candidatus Dadabacteria bacterium]|nr:MAG: M23 family metallopeptidase [Candidatus Dadabacteria bacterium]
MKRKANQGYTIVVVPEGQGQVRRVRLDPERLRRLTIAAIALCVLGAASVIYSMYNLATLPERWRVEEQLLAQELHLSQISDRLSEAEKTLARVNRLDRKLRVVLGTGEGMSEAQVGVGGPSPDSVERFDALPDERSRMLFARLDARTSDLEQNARLQELRLYDLDSVMEDQSARLASTPSLWPTRGWVTSGFGPRHDPFTGRKKIHEGIDIATRRGNPVVAPADGVVLFAGVKSGYGNVIILDHGYGIITRYGHLSRIDVKPGQKVERGMVIGSVGSTGRSTGPHLHYEIRVAGVPVNPYRFILTEDAPLP